MNFYTIAYDITDDKRRREVAKCLENYGSRVQYSVFEVLVSEEILKEIIEKLKRIINIREDSVRIYYICNSCLKKTFIIGEGEITKDADIYIV